MNETVVGTELQTDNVNMHIAMPPSTLRFRLQNKSLLKNIMWPKLVTMSAATSSLRSSAPFFLELDCS